MLLLSQLLVTKYVENYSHLISHFLHRAEAYLEFQRERDGVRMRDNNNKTKKVEFREGCPQCGAGFQRVDASYCWSCGKQLDE
jgi:hypothetical protein